MRKYKIFILFVLFAFLTFSLSACLKQKIINRPVDQPFSEWASEDETIHFKTDENGAGYGTLITKDNIIPIYFATGAGKSIEIYTLKEGIPDRLIERWNGNFKKKDKFIAVVSGMTTFYEEGDRIVFHRI